MPNSKKAKAKKRDPTRFFRTRDKHPAAIKEGLLSSAQLTQKNAAFAKAASAKARDAIMVRMRKHLEEARAHSQPGGGAIAIDAAAIGASERAWTADDRSVAMKDRGVSTARRSDFRVHGNPGVAPPPPQYDKGGFELLGGSCGVVANVSRMPLIPKGSSRLVVGVIGDSLSQRSVFFCCRSHLL
jgi:hypothetical protein